MKIQTTITNSPFHKGTIKVTLKKQGKKWVTIINRKSPFAETTEEAWNYTELSYALARYNGTIRAYTDIAL